MGSNSARRQASDTSKAKGAILSMGGAYHGIQQDDEATAQVQTSPNVGARRGSKHHSVGSTKGRRKNDGDTIPYPPGARAV